MDSLLRSTPIRHGSRNEKFEGLDEKFTSNVHIHKNISIRFKFL